MRLNLLESLNVIQIKENVISKVQKKSERTKRVSSDKSYFDCITFLNKIGQHMLDTYLIVILAIQEICYENFEIQEEKLITELHTQIITMHQQSLVQQL